MIQNDKNNFWIEMNISSLPNETSINNYLVGQTRTIGILENQGLVKLPTMDFSYIRTWKNNNIQIMQFFLFKNNHVLEVIVWPSDSPNTSKSDNIISSIRFY
jgi:hypothetical protein